MTFNTAYYAATGSIAADAHRFAMEYSDVIDDDFLAEWLPWSIRAPLGGLVLSAAAVSPLSSLLTFRQSHRCLVVRIGTVAKNIKLGHSFVGMGGLTSTRIDAAVSSPGL
jgi:hypothetical protein